MCCLLCMFSQYSHSGSFAFTCGLFFPVRQQHVEVYILNMWTYNEVATETGLLLAMDHFLLHDNQCLAC